ncbi:MraY family glycosyltransferase [Sinomonas sp. ASV486]|uniref:MraY family glycosyltransferase n=1 Tax=Sinomonas sp. ASV486 TaxID=3051170 RepID=UPI0027DCB880|nr:MraY family glycosyltransferase [Sinomonas sp. ASV486]MDQ4490547.1 MraY family glycosyltransferase [Sinomonas sp. ASV486]
MFIYLLVAMLAAVVTYAATGVVRAGALRLGIVSPVRERDVHTRTVPRLGGLAMFAGFAVAFAAASQTFWLRSIFVETAQPWAVLWGAGVIVVVGAIDDIVDLNSWVKLCGQLVAAAIVAVWGPRVTFLPLGALPVTEEWLQIGLTMFLIVLTVNAINFVDGLDGLAAGVAAIGGLAFFITAYWVHRNALLPNYTDLATLLMALLIGICLGFLPHNVNPAKIFMGDSGSMLLGLLMATGAVVATGQIGSGLYDRAEGIPAYFPVILPIVVMSLPFLDLVLAVLRRTTSGRSPFSPDREHVHHKLLDLGYTHRQAVAVMYVWAAFVAFGGAAYAFVPWMPLTLVNLIVLPTVAFLTMHPWVRQTVGNPSSRPTWLHWSLWVPRFTLPFVASLATATALGFTGLANGGVAFLYSTFLGLGIAVLCGGAPVVILHFAAPTLPFTGRTLIADLLMKLAALAIALLLVGIPGWAKAEWYWLSLVACGAVWLMAQALVALAQWRPTAPGRRANRVGA